MSMKSISIALVFLAILFFVGEVLAISPGARYPGGANLQHREKQSETPENPNLTENRKGGASNTGASMLDQIKQETQMCKPDGVVVVKALQRSLNMVGGEIIQSATKGVGAHVQVVAYDKRTGAIIDNFGLTGDLYPIGKARIEVEKSEDIWRKYDQKPLGEMEMSRECYEQASARTKKQLEASDYSALNDVDLAKSVVLGAVVGGIDGYIKGGKLNSIKEAGRMAVKSGINAATEQYDGKNFMIVSDNAKQMSVPGINCQVPYMLLSKNAEGDHSLTIVQEYQLPGKSVSDVTSSYDTLYAPTDTSTRDGLKNESGRKNAGKEAAEASQQKAAVEEIRPNDDSQVGVRGWCRCKHSDKHIVGMPPMARYMYSICLKCGKVEKGTEGYRGIMILDTRYKMSASSEEFHKARAAQAKLFAIPDGQVVIPGKCTCPGTKKASDFVRAGGMMVHIDCGRVMVK